MDVRRSLLWQTGTFQGQTQSSRQAVYPTTFCIVAVAVSPGEAIELSLWQARVYLNGELDQFVEAELVVSDTRDQRVWLLCVPIVATGDTNDNIDVEWPPPDITTTHLQAVKSQ